MKRYWVIVIFMAGFLWVSPVFAHVSKIQQDYAAAQISNIERITYAGYLLFAPEKLPPKYQTETQYPIKCATNIVMDLKTHFYELAPADQAIFAKVLDRPTDLPNYFISPSGKFKLHYTLTGTDKVAADDTDGSGIPDFIEIAAENLDYCYLVEVDSLGYQPPPDDFSTDGPEIDVYFKNIYNAYAYTYFESQVESTPYYDWTSYLILENDFQGNFYTKGIDALKVTIAHEFFHMIQGGYYIGYENLNFKDLFFYEMSSTWMEERVFTEVNDYYQYLGEFFSHPEYPLCYWNGIYEYGAAIFFIFTQQKYDETIIRRSWEILKNSYNKSDFNSIKALDQAFSEAGASFADAFSDFGIWNYFTGFRSNRPKFYKEAGNYPMLVLQDSSFLQPEVVVSDTAYNLTLSYHVVIPESAGNIFVRQSHSEPEYWQSAIVINRAEPDIVSEIHPQSIEDLGLVNSSESIVLISANVHVPQNTSNVLSKYTKSISQFNFSTQSFGGEERIFPNPFIAGKHQILKMKADIPRKEELECFILTETGRVIFQKPLGVQSGSALLQISWNGTLADGALAASGVYICLISGRDVNIPFKFVLIRQ